MRRILTFFLLLIASHFVDAQQESENQAIKKVIETFFEGLHQGDSTTMATTLHKELKIQTTYTNGQQQKILRTETRNQLLINISKKKPTEKYEEKLLSYDIKVDGNLASVWTPYEFYLNDRKVLH